MSEFQGVAIQERTLWIFAILSLLGILVLAVFTVISVLWLFRNKKEELPALQKQNKRIKMLRKKAEVDPSANKQLKRRLRKKQSGLEIFGPSIALFILTASTIGFVLPLWTIPTWQDVLKKDYKMYTGHFECTYERKNYYAMELDDGTILDAEWHMVGEGNAKIVYAPRTKTVIGFERFDDARP